VHRPREMAARLKAQKAQRAEKAQKDNLSHGNELSRYLEAFGSCERHGDDARRRKGASFVI